MEVYLERWIYFREVQSFKIWKFIQMRGNLSCVQLIMSKQQEQMIVILLR